MTWDRRYFSAQKGLPLHLVMALGITFVSCRTPHSAPLADQGPQGETDNFMVFEIQTSDMRAEQAANLSESSLSLDTSGADGRVCCACYFAGHRNCNAIVEKENCDAFGQNSDETDHTDLECRWLKEKGKPGRCVSRSERACRNWLEYEKPQAVCDVKSSLPLHVEVDPFKDETCDVVRVSQQFGERRSQNAVDIDYMMDRILSHQPAAKDYSLVYYGCYLDSYNSSTYSGLFATQEKLKEGQCALVRIGQVYGSGEGRTKGGKPVLDKVTGETVRNTSFMSFVVDPETIKIVLEPCEDHRECSVKSRGENMRCLNKDGQNFQKCCCPYDKSGKLDNGSCRFVPGAEECPGDAEHGYKNDQNRSSDWESDDDTDL